MKPEERERTELPLQPVKSEIEEVRVLAHRLRQRAA